MKTFINQSSNNFLFLLFLFYLFSRNVNFSLMIKIQQKNCGRDLSLLLSRNKYIERIADSNMQQLFCGYYMNRHNKNNKTDYDVLCKTIIIGDVCHHLSM